MKNVYQIATQIQYLFPKNHLVLT